VGAEKGVGVEISVGVGVAGEEQAEATRRNKGMLTANVRLIIFGLDMGKPLKLCLKRVKYPLIIFKEDKNWIRKDKELDCYGEFFFYSDFRDKYPILQVVFLCLPR